MTNSIKKKLQSITKYIGYSIFSFLFGRIKGIINSANHELIDVIKTTFDESSSYKIFKIKKGRIYTDTINDTAFITENKLIEGPSFQLRNVKNSNISNNIVLTKGTPRFRKELKGSVFSLLTGGAGNSNYWHWLYDVLPRLKILEDKIDINEIDYFLFPDLKEKFQIQTLDFLKIPKEKRISSKKFRHIQSDIAFAVDHPYVINNDPSNEIQNIPEWIIHFLRAKFLKKTSKQFPRKFYIDRRDAKSNHSKFRKIINEEDLKKFLIKKGYSIITLSDLPFEDQVNLFNNASEIVGLHGAGFANLTFCKPQTLILELKTINAGFMYSNLAKKLKLNFRDISVEASTYSNDQQGLISIPLISLEEKLN